MTRRICVFIYSVVCYLIGFGVLLYLIGFIGGLGLPTSLDGPRTVGLATAMTTNISLILLFALQHSVMARPAFKRWLAQWVPTQAERSTYVLMSSLTMLLLFVGWQPLGATVWDLQAPVARAGLWGLFALGWIMVFGSSFLINHFDLFGLRQGWLCLRDKPYTPLPFTTPGPYRLVRHPLYVGWITAAWATPTMGAAHLMFALIMTGYIVMAIRWEERDLVDALGEDYQQYQQQVPKLLPAIRPGRQVAQTDPATV